VRLERCEGLEVAALVAIIVAFAAGREYLDDHQRVRRRLTIVRRMRRLTADDRTVAVATARGRGDPESLIGVEAVTYSRHAHAAQGRQARRDRVVLVGAAGHRDDHAVDELVPTLAVLFRGEVVRIRRPSRQTQQSLHKVTLACRSEHPANVAST